MKNLIFNINIDPNNVSNEIDFREKKGAKVKPDSKLMEYSTIRGKRYAERCGADFLSITDYLIEDYAPTWQKFVMFKKNLSKYDNICYYDSDLIILDTMPNIFELMHNTDYNFYAAPALADKYEIRNKIGYFNAGFISVKRKWLDIWNEKKLKPLMERWKQVPHRDQECLNYMVKTTLDKYCLLNSSWNCKADIKLKMKNRMDQCKMKTVFGMHYVDYRKKHFNITDLESFEKNLMNKSNSSKNYQTFEISNNWKNFQGSILDFEKKVNRK